MLLSSAEVRTLWMRDNAGEMLRPSIDRIDNNGNYEFANCRFVEMEENCIKEKNVPVLCIKNNEIVEEFNSLANAKRKTGAGIGNIWMCLNGKRKQAKGFSWKYKEASRMLRVNKIGGKNV